MRWVQSSIPWLMFLIFLVALDCALLGSLGGSDDPSIIRLTILVLMGDSLAIGLFRIMTRRDAAHHFLVGFELAGLAGVLLFVAFPSPISWVVSIVHDRLEVSFRHRLIDFEAGDPRDRLVTIAILIIIPAVLIASPLLATALFGGWLYRLALQIRTSRDSPTRPM